VQVGDLADGQALLLEGWSVRHACGESVCRDVDGQARLLAPLERPARFDLAVHAAGEGTLSAVLNGVALGAQPLTAETSRVRFRIDRPWRLLNVISLAVAPGGRARIERIVLEPRGDAS
jgi:hypothetical protein